MIQPNDLRIGNIVSLKNGYNTELPKYGKVTQVYMNGFTVDYHWPDEWFEPVELTPDILEAAGFGVNKDNSFGYINENEGILIELGDFYEDDGRAVFYYNLPDTDNSTCIAYCKYLQQLQNLYFALTGDELQIDITKLNK